MKDGTYEKIGAVIGTSILILFAAFGLGVFVSCFTNDVWKMCVIPPAVFVFYGLVQDRGTS